jgi:uncharacterized phage-like protein YoqJ
MNPTASWVKEMLSKAIHRALARRADIFISGGALGVDQWAADLVIEARAVLMGKSGHNQSNIRLIIAKPFSDQESR